MNLDYKTDASPSDPAKRTGVDEMGVGDPPAPQSAPQFSVSMTPQVAEQVESKLQVSGEEFVSSGSAGRYCRTIAQYPLPTLAALAFILCCTSAIGFAVAGFPDFGEADKGFEARGTEITGRTMAARRVIFFSDGLSTSSGFQSNLQRASKSDSLKAVRRANRRSLHRPEYREYQTNAHRSLGSSKISEKKIPTSLRQSALPFCTGAISASVLSGQSASVNVVFENTGDDPRGLYNLESVKYMCEVSLAIENANRFDEVCLNAEDDFGTCCKPRSVGDWSALVPGVDCSELTQEHLDDLFVLAKLCAPHYYSGDLRNCLTGLGGCEALPEECADPTTAVGIADSLFYLTDAEFLNPAFGSPEKIVFSKVVADIRDEWLEPMKTVIDAIEPFVGKDDRGARLVAYGIGDDIKFELFNEQLIADIVFGVLASIVVSCLLWLHTGSYFIAAMSMLQIVLNMGTSYFLYVCILQMPFFPFLNLTSLFVIIGIGADDVFVWIDAWKQSFSLLPKGTELADRLSWALGRAGSSMFVTSFTTAVAFFANAISTITSIRCFGVFAGCLVLSNYLFMMSWLPCITVLDHLYVHKSCGNGKGCSRFCAPVAEEDIEADVNKAEVESSLQFGDSNETHSSEQVKDLPLRPVERFFRDKFVILVTDRRWVAFWLITCTALGGLGAVWTISSPGLDFPLTSEFALFKSGHPMEKYDQVYSRKFESGLETVGRFAINLWFGVEPKDNGNHLDPDDFGFDKFVDLDIYGEAAQTWLLKLCDESTQNAIINSVQTCPFQQIKEMGMASCNMSDGNLTIPWGMHGCCAQSSYPFSQPVLQKCILAWMDEHQNCYRGCDVSHFSFWTDSEARVKVLRLGFWSEEYGSDQYNKVDKQYKIVNTWAKELLETAPEGTGLSDGFYLGHSGRMFFYQLRTALADGAYSAMSLSLAVSCGILILSNGNPVITGVALLSIFFILMLCVGTLVQEGWVLGVTEAVVISVAVGMAVDFTVHYGHAYTRPSRSWHKTRVERLTGSLTDMGVSITMGALTTLAAACSLMFSTLHFYYNFGAFLSLCMVLSWSYAGFFFLGILSLIGPEGESVTWLHSAMGI